MSTLAKLFSEQKLETFQLFSKHILKIFNLFLPQSLQLFISRWLFLHQFFSLNLFKIDHSQLNFHLFTRILIFQSLLKIHFQFLYSFVQHSLSDILLSHL